MDQFVNSVNRTPYYQKFFQSTSDLVFLKTPKDKAVYKFMMVGTTAIIGSVFYGVACMATGHNKIKRS